MSYQDPVQKVLETVELQDMILDYVIHDKNKVSYADVRSCRLVNHAWMDSTSRSLHNCREPLFQLYLSDLENEKLIDTFTSAVTGPSRMEMRIPTFRMFITANFFRRRNYDSLLKCFSQCGSSLMDLEISFPSYGGSCTFTTFPHIAFPKLRKFTMELTYWNPELEDGETGFGSANGVCLMNLVLSGCKNLQVLKLSGGACEKKHCEVLLRNDLSKLEKLNLYIGDATHMEHGMLSKILENVKIKITHLTIDGYDDSGCYFRLPVMKHLKYFRTYATLRWESEGGVSMLQNCVPNVEKLLLGDINTSMFQNWTDSATYNSVRELSVRLFDNSKGYYKSFPSEMMQRVEVAFPNIRSLEVTVCGTEFCGLKYVFANLKTLQTLKIMVSGTQVTENSNCWDALLIGTPVEYVSSLRSTRKYWNKVKCESSEEHPSIKNLTELQELLLSSDISSLDPLISDVAFYYAFLEMPKLQTIHFGGRFKASPTMQRKWSEKSNGQVTYNYYPPYTVFGAFLGFGGFG